MKQRPILFIVPGLLALFAVMVALHQFGVHEKKIREAEKKIESLAENHDALLIEQNKLQETIASKDGEIQALTGRLDSQSASIKKLQEENKALKKQQAAIAKSKAVLTSRGVIPKGKTLTMRATAYTAYCNGCSGLTRWKALNLRKNPSLKVIAVDPHIIPLGSKVWVEGYGYAIAADTGGAIKGHKIDVFVPVLADAFEFGVKTLTVKVLES